MTVSTTVSRRRRFLLSFAALMFPASLWAAIAGRMSMLSTSARRKRVLRAALVPALLMSALIISPVPASAYPSEDPDQGYEWYLRPGNWCSDTVTEGRQVEGETGATIYLEIDGVCSNDLPRYVIWDLSRIESDDNEPDDSGEGPPYVCDRAPDDPDWDFDSADTVGEQWRFVLGTGRRAGAMVVTFLGDTFTTADGYAGLREINPSTGAIRLILNSGPGIDASAGNCYHLKYTPGAAAGDPVAGTLTRYGSYIANSTIPITGERVYDCGEAGLLSVPQVSGIDALLASSAEDPPGMLEAFRDDPCLITRGSWQEADGSSEDVFADIAGPAALPGRTVQNRYEFRVSIPVQSCEGIICGPPVEADVVMGYAILEKTWYWTGGRVVDSGGEEPDPAKLTGGATTLGTLLGYSWKGVLPGSQVDTYAPYNGNGQGAHVSSRDAQLQWEVPIAGVLIAFKPLWTQELLIKGKADGTVECRGGNTCRGVPTP